MAFILDRKARTEAVHAPETISIVKDDKYRTYRPRRFLYLKY